MSKIVKPDVAWQPCGRAQADQLKAESDRLREQLELHDGCGYHPGPAHRADYDMAATITGVRGVAPATGAVVVQGAIPRHVVLYRRQQVSKVELLRAIVRRSSSRAR